MKYNEEYGEDSPNFLNTLLGMVIGFLETGMGFLQTLFGFMVIRFFYSIPVWLVVNFILTPQFGLPTMSYIDVWLILIAFDSIRFDITKFITLPNKEKEY